MDTKTNHLAQALATSKDMMTDLDRSLTKEKERANAMHLKMESVSNDAASTIEKLRNRVEQLDHEKENLQALVEESTQKADQARKDVQNARDQHAKVRDNAKGLKERLHQAEAALSVAKSELGDSATKNLGPGACPVGREGILCADTQGVPSRSQARGGTCCAGA